MPFLPSLVGISREESLNSQINQERLPISQDSNASILNSVPMSEIHRHQKTEVGSVDSKVRGIVCMFAFCKQSLQNVTEGGTTSMTWVYLLNRPYDVGDSKKMTIKRNIVTKSVSEFWFRMIGWRFRLQVQMALKYRPWGSARLSVGCGVEIIR